jgi:hypothetical protein
MITSKNRPYCANKKLIYSPVKHKENYATYDRYAA